MKVTLNYREVKVAIADALNRKLLGEKALPANIEYVMTRAKDKGKEKSVPEFIVTL